MTNHIASLELWMNSHDHNMFHFVLICMQSDEEGEIDLEENLLESDEETDQESVQTQIQNVCTFHRFSSEICTLISTVFTFRHLPLKCTTNCFAVWNSSFYFWLQEQQLWMLSTIIQLVLNGFFFNYLNFLLNYNIWSVVLGPECIWLFDKMKSQSQSCMLRNELKQNICQKLQKTVQLFWSLLLRPLTTRVLENSRYSYKNPHHYQIYTTALLFCLNAVLNCF